MEQQTKSILLDKRHFGEILQEQQMTALGFLGNELLQCKTNLELLLKASEINTSLIKQSMSEGSKTFDFTPLTLGCDSLTYETVESFIEFKIYGEDTSYILLTFSYEITNSKGQNIMVSGEKLDIDKYTFSDTAEIYIYTSEVLSSLLKGKPDEDDGMVTQVEQFKKQLTARG